jgi:hypothetical protein
MFYSKWTLVKPGSLFGDNEGSSRFRLLSLITFHSSIQIKFQTLFPVFILVVSAVTAFIVLTALIPPNPNWEFFVKCGFQYSFRGIKTGMFQFKKVYLLHCEINSQCLRLQKTLAFSLFTYLTYMNEILKLVISWTYFKIHISLSI